MTAAQDCPPRRRRGYTRSASSAPHPAVVFPGHPGLHPDPCWIISHQRRCPRTRGHSSTEVSQQGQRPRSPRRSGLHRSKKLPPQPPVRSPRVNGAAPQPLFLHNDRQIPPPSTRGCTPYIIVGIEPNTDLPGHPGLRLHPLHGPFAGLPFPPTRGAAPIRPPRRGLMRTLSPDTRGYASQSHTHPVDTSAFPAGAGLNLYSLTQPCTASSSPHRHGIRLSHGQ